MLTKLENYRVFCKVAQHKSFSGAAQELFLSQPAVSQSVRQLEEQLRMQLQKGGADPAGQHPV